MFQKINFQLGLNIKSLCTQEKTEYRKKINNLLKMEKKSWQRHVKEGGDGNSYLPIGY